MRSYVIYKEGEVVVSGDDKDKAVALAKRRFPNATMVGATIEDGKEINGFFVGMAPTALGC